MKNYTLYKHLIFETLTMGAQQDQACPEFGYQVSGDMHENFDEYRTPG